MLLVLLVAAGCREQSARQDDARAVRYYTEAEPSRSGGTGRIYMGREIAPVMGHTGAGWLERPTRETAELPDRVVRNLDLDSTDVVADIGAGTGYFTFRMAPFVPRGQVLAVDIQPEMLGIIRDRMSARGVRNVTPVLGSEDDPHLPPSAVDVALMVDAYHEFYYPREMMERVVEALRPGGRVVLVEYRGEDPTLNIKPLHTMTEAQARAEMEAVGLEWVQTKDFLPQQHFIVFEKPSV